MVETCPICCDNYNKSSRKKVTCLFCEHEQCRACTERYMLSVLEDPHCCNCKNAWSREFIDTWSTKTFIDKQLRKHREDILFDREKVLFPQAQRQIEAMRRARDIRGRVSFLRNALFLEFRRHNLYDLPYSRRDEFINANFPEIRDMMNELRASYRELDEAEDALGDLQNEADRAETAGETFVRKCPTEDCRGFLSKEFGCTLCGGQFCEHCNEPLTADVEHTCDPDTVATFKLLAGDTKQCPKCGMGVTKTEGCSQMWCTECHCVFNFKTGLIQRGGHIHNPHYNEHRRANQASREHGDIPCGGAPTYLELSQLEVKPPMYIYDYFFDVQRINRDLDWLQNFTNRSTRAYRLWYMQKHIDEKEFKRQIQLVDRKKAKDAETIQLYQTVSDTSADLLRQYMLGRPAESVAEEANAFIRICNDYIREIHKRFKCWTPRYLKSIDLNRT